MVSVLTNSSQPQTTNQIYVASSLGVVCPACHGRLVYEPEKMSCAGCGMEFSYCNGFPDLIIGGRFDDPTDEAQLLYEEQSNTDTTKEYLIPTLRKWWPEARKTRPRLLSLGCGTGIDIDLLCEEGYDCVGIDCGNRTSTWPRRKHHERLLLANGKHLPFESASFDCIFCGCVFPHVGVVGDSFTVAEHYREDRLGLAREMTRVLRPKGKILVSSPNRFFPFDIFHGRPNGGYKPRPYKPSDPFLLSVNDYRRLFQEAGCRTATAQPVKGYWGFIRSKNSLKGYVMALPVRAMFWLASVGNSTLLRSSPLNPWIVVLIEK